MGSIAERHKFILDELQKNGYITVSDVAKALGVTVVTVRKDFKDLEQKGLLYRTHGSATPVRQQVGDVSVPVKEKVNADLKDRIGREAVKLIEPNDSIIIASGSTIHAFANYITNEMGPLNVVTPSIKIAIMLNSLESVTVIMMGGVVHKKSLSVHLEYSNSLSFNDFSCSKLFIGADGVNPEFGVTTSNLEEAHMTREMMAASTKTIVLVDSSKFSQHGFGRICPLDQINTVVTDSGVTPAVVKTLEDAGIEVIIAK
jgi:DeoR family transcriptional regulator of aga operon